MKPTESCRNMSPAIDTSTSVLAEELYRRAVQVMPGGVSRNTVLRQPHPMYVSYGSGCRIVDIDGEERIDFANNMASLIHGHAAPQVMEAVSNQLKLGTAFTMATEVEVQYAEHLCSRNRSFERVRFVNSGTEAVMGALKAARAFTGRPKIAKVEGAYHGSYDFAEVSQTSDPQRWGPIDAPRSVPVVEGTPESVLSDVIVVPFNDPDRAVDILSRHSGEIACVLLDVMPHRAGLYPATREFVQALSGWADADGALLVADEVITFRTEFGGAQQRYDVVPDITALGKIIGGGFPVGAITGRAEVLDVMNPHGSNYRMPYSGTFSANPISMTAGLEAMKQFDADAVARINALTAQAIDGVMGVIAANDFEASVCGMGSMLRVHMQRDLPTSYRLGYLDEQKATRQKRFFELMSQHGMLVIYSGAAAISTAMTDSDISQFVGAAEASLHRMRDENGA